MKTAVENHCSGIFPSVSYAQVFSVPDKHPSMIYPQVPSARRLFKFSLSLLNLFFHFPGNKF